MTAQPRNECDPLARPSLRRLVCWNGKRYVSIDHASHALGIDESTIRWRLRHGYTCDADMKRKPYQPKRLEALD